MALYKWQQQWSSIGRHSSYGLYALSSLWLLCLTNTLITWAQRKCAPYGTLYSHRHRKSLRILRRDFRQRWGARPRVFKFPMLHAFHWLVYAHHSDSSGPDVPKENHQPENSERRTLCRNHFWTKIHQPPLAFCGVFSSTSSRHEVTYTMIHLFSIRPVRSTGPRIFNPHQKPWEILVFFFRERRILTTPGRFRKGRTGQNNWLGKPEGWRFQKATQQSQ